MKFAEELIEMLDRARFDITTDRWQTLSTHDESASLDALVNADVVVCEWCGPNAVWYSHQLRPEQRLIIRLHRFEIETEFPGLVNAGAVSAVVTVSDHYRNLTRAAMPTLASERVQVIGNGVDITKFDQPKAEDARFRIGMIGAIPRRKRLDRALDILAAVRQYDNRFTLLTKSHLPWDHPWIWNDSNERKYFSQCYERIQSDPLLAGAVAFDPPGPDVSRWLTDVGSVVSTSDDESFHLAPAEGMASGAVPIILPWPAAASVYPNRWIVATVEQAAKRVLELVEPSSWAALSAASVIDARRFDRRSMVEKWTNLLNTLSA